MLRSHLGPFLFALGVLTGILYVNAVARRLADLAGKGLTFAVWGKFLLLSLPHIVALTLPMAVLVAVLYAFSSLAADNEVTALKASGINLLRLLMPVLVAGAILAMIMVWFNDRLLPNTNHALKNLTANIAAKSPTLALTEQVLQEIPTTTDFGTRYFIRAGRIDHNSGRLKDVSIYDLSNNLRRRTIYADSGRMGFSQDTTDLYLTLYSGEMYTVNAQQPGTFERVRFVEQRNVVHGAGNKWNLDAADDYRSDREMSLAMLAAHIDSTRTDLASALSQVRRQSEQAVEGALRGPAALDEPPADSTPFGIPPSNFLPGYHGGGYDMSDQMIGRAANEIQAFTNRAEDLQHRIDQYRVEYHKKYAIPFACIVFVLVGAPLAVRFPRGGAGMVIAISLTIFGIYYVSLIGGESLGDDGIIAPFVGPWAPNLAFGLLALWGLSRIGRETATTRGGDWDDLWRTTVHFLTRPFRRGRSRPGLSAGRTARAAEGGD